MSEHGLGADHTRGAETLAVTKRDAAGAARPGGLTAAHVRDAELLTGRTRRARLWAAAEARHVPLRAILATVGVVVAVYLAGKVVYRLKEVILLLVISGFIALLLDPLVVLLQRVVRGHRGVAVTIVTIFALLAFAGLALAFGYPLVHALTHFAQVLPGYVTSAEHNRGWIGHLVTKYHVKAWIEKNAPKLAGYGQDLANPALSLGKGALSLLVALFTIFVLVVLLLLEGPKLRRGTLSLMSADRAARYTAIAREVNRSVTGYMLGNFATSLIAGLVVFLTLALLGVPFPFLWALWVALVDFLPMIGGALAGIPTVLFAFAHSLAAGVVTLIVFLVYTQVENHILNPVIMSRTVRINPLLVLVAILVGVSLGSWVGGFFGGFVAALLSIPLAGAAQVIVREMWRETAPPGTPGASLPALAVASAATSPADTGPADTGRADTGRADTGPAGVSPADTGQAADPAPSPGTVAPAVATD